MDSSQILTITVFVIVITIVGTIALAVVGYLAFRLRDRSHPTGSGLDQGMSKPYFFERVRLPGTEDDDAADAGTRALPAAEASDPDAATAEAPASPEDDPAPDPDGAPSQRTVGG